MSPEEDPPPWPPGRKPPLRWPRRVLLILIALTAMAGAWIAANSSHMTSVPPAPAATFSPSFLPSP